jgi:hypothetical protein
MPLLRKGIVMPVKGIDFSLPATFISDQSGFPKNMYYYRGELRKRPGKTLVGSAISGGQIMGMARLELNTGIKYLVRSSKTAIEKYNTSTLVWEAISASPFTGGDDDFFSFATVTEDGLLIVSNNGIGGLRQWPGYGNTSLLGGSPPKAKFMAYLSPYLLLANVDDGVNINPWKVQWCDTGDCQKWTGGNSGAQVLGDEPSPIMNIVKLNEFAGVYKKDSLWLGQKVSTTDVFQFSCTKTGIGLSASRAIAEAEGIHYFMAANDFYAWNGMQPSSIGAPVREEVFGKIDRKKIQRCFAIHVQELTEIWFFVICAGDSWPKEVWKYNYRNTFWYYDTCSELTAAIKWEKILSETWHDDTPGTWDEALDRWDSGDSIAAWEEVVFGGSDGNTQKIDYTKADDCGSAVEGIFETKDFIGNSLELNTRWLQIDFWARGSPGAKLFVDYSTDGGSIWKNIPYSSSKAYIELTESAVQYHLYFDVYAPQARFRVRNAESGEIFYVRAFYPFYLSKEQRR